MIYVSTIMLALGIFFGVLAVVVMVASDKRRND